MKAEIAYQGNGMMGEDGLEKQDYSWPCDHQ